MGKSLVPPASGGGDHIEPVDLKKALEERYLAYALSTIMHRALPDVRDGLKPVHRRIMHAMRLLRLNPDQGFAKCARIVGEVMGKFHPHGDQSIYDALVRLAQDFAVRYPLVDGQGNFGNIDGDNAAAMRYTEARMTEVATALLEGITEDAVDFRPTYNEEDEEPVVLPGAFPNILANGSSGIAVGMATSIPPHNAAELCAAALHLIDNRDASVADLMTSPEQWADIERRHQEELRKEDKDAVKRAEAILLECKVRGPDFPTGGMMVDGWASMIEAYETGRGGFRLRAKWEQEDQGRGTWTIVVTEIPYQVQKSKLIEKIAELLLARKLPLLEDVRDESAEDIRVVLMPKSRTVDPGLLMELLFKLTELETRFPLNMNVLSRGKVPNVLSLKSVLAEWLEHRKDVLVRRSKHRLGEIERRLEILGGYLIAYLNIDEVIRIIREEDEPKQVMMARWSLTDNQAEAILNMRLRALRKLEEIRDPQGVRRALGREEADRGAAGVAGQAVEDDPLGSRRDAEEIRPRHRSRPPPHRFRRCAGARRRRYPPRHDREGADHGRGLGKGLAARDEGPSERPVAAHLQGRRQPEARLPGADDRQDPRLHHRRQVLHDRRRPAAGRPRPWRADPHHRRHGERPGHRHRLRARSEAQAAARQPRRQRLHRSGSRGRRQHPQGQAGDERQVAGRGFALRRPRRAIISPSSARTARC